MHQLHAAYNMRLETYIPAGEDTGHGWRSKSAGNLTKSCCRSAFFCFSFSFIFHVIFHHTISSCTAPVKRCSCAVLVTRVLAGIEKIEFRQGARARVCINGHGDIFGAREMLDTSTFATLALPVDTTNHVSLSRYVLAVSFFFFLFSFFKEKLSWY
jgi:hypothetical protein